MSTKFEQLLDYLVNEDHGKAEELFHEIVVEKSRDIYENLIAEEEAEDEEVEESKDDDLEESEDDDLEESDVDLEDSYAMDEADPTGDDTDDFGGAISADGDNFDAPQDDEHDHEKSEDSAIMDIKNAIQELEAAFAELEAAQGEETAGMGTDDFGDDEEDEVDTDENMMGMPMENRRMTREYWEKVNHKSFESGGQKEQGAFVAGGTGETMSKPVDGTSPVSSGKGKPVSGANSKNIANGGDEGQSNTGEKPRTVTKGITPNSGEKFASGINNVDHKQSGVKTLAKQGSGYPGNNKSAGPVGSGTGDKAGQTSVSADKPFLKKL